MSKYILPIALVIFFNLCLNAQDTIRLHHKEYTTVFSKSLKYPVLVEWWLTKAKLNCKNPLPRKDQFAQDPLLANETDLTNDYIASGFDRGHMSPAADNQCSGAEPLKESFYFSNISPQKASLNRGDWKSLEMKTRDLVKTYDSVKIWAGSVGEKTKVHRLSIPTKCWKVIHIKSTNQWYAYIFNNDDSKPNGIEDNLVNLIEVEKLTKFKFK